MPRKQVRAPNYWFFIAAVAIALLIAVLYQQSAGSNGNTLQAGNLYGQAIAPTKSVTPTRTTCLDTSLTPKNACSLKKPMYCDSNLRLISNPVKCGCPAGQALSSSGLCTTPPAYEMKTYIEDDLDFSNDTNRSTTQSSRFRLGVSSFGPGLGPKVITKDQTSIMNPAYGLPSNGRIMYPKGSTTTFENQNIYAFAYTNYDETSKRVEAKYSKTGYEAVFVEPIPLCLDTASSEASCSPSDLLKNNGVEFTFLGEKYSVIDHVASGGQVTSLLIGKMISRMESFNIGQSVTTLEGYVVRLADISAFSP
ncbi:MAG: hypothetical protein ABH863_04890, partial [Candidatus Micrarchaeota archaeon]